MKQVILILFILFGLSVSGCMKADPNKIIAIGETVSNSEDVVEGTVILPDSCSYFQIRGLSSTHTYVHRGDCKNRIHFHQNL